MLRCDASLLGFIGSFSPSVNPTLYRGLRLSLTDGGQRLEADVVLANADLPYVYRELLPLDGQAEKLSRKRYSCSVVSFYWGVDQPYQTLGPHTLFLADDYRQNFSSIIRDLSLPANPSLYIHAPARLDPSMAPAGQDTLIAIVPVGHLSEAGDQDWDLLRDRARQDIFRRLRTLGIDDLEEHIKFEINFTPLSWRKRYNLVKGSTLGLCHTLTQLGYFHPDFQHPRYRDGSDFHFASLKRFNVQTLVLSLSKGSNVVSPPQTSTQTPPLPH